ncbi:E3 ubiquitin-protein ligase arih2 [Pichia californica]|nr:E3 ubiquitin-protein ligase arih2 [[Candida] californica]
MAGPVSSPLSSNDQQDQQNLTQIQLPAIGPVHSTPSKKSNMKKRLSRMAFPFSEKDDQPNHLQSFDYDLNGSNISLDNTTFDATEDSSILPIVDQKPTSTNSFALNGSVPSSNVDTNMSATHNIHNKLNRSTSSLANSFTSSLQKLPYKSSNTNLSSTSVPNQTQSQAFPQSTTTLTGLNNTLTQSSGNPKLINFNHNVSTSPNKVNSRYLATNNDHTFTLSKQPHTTLVPPQDQNQKQSHSQSSSINNISDDLALSTTNTNTNLINIPSNVSTKVIHPTTLPQFTSVNNQNNNNNNNNNNLITSNTILAPPTVLAPVYKTNSSSTQGTSQAFYSTNNNSSLMYLNHNNTQPVLQGPAPSISETMSSAATSNIRQQKKGTGLLQNAYRSSHHTKDKNNGSANNNSSNLANTNTSNDQSTDNIDAEILQNDMICIDSKHHFISPKITKQFILLQHLIQLGIKKRMEYLDSENTSLLHDINKYYDELDNVYNQLVIQVTDLDNYIATLNSKKETDVKTLQQHNLFENLNDLTNRIENVKKNMNLKKDMLKMFDLKLNSLFKLKAAYEQRNRDRKHIVFVIFITIFVLFVLRGFVRKFL